MDKTIRSDRHLKVLYSAAAFLGVFAAVIIDQLTKYLAVRFLKTGEPVELISGVLELHYLENRGAAFGIMQNMQYIFVAGAILILIILYWIYHRMPYTKRYMPLRICAVLLSSGAVGNAIDRLHQNFVVDFIYFKLIDFPIFNVADCYVVISCIVFALLIIFYYKDDNDFKFLTIGKE